MPQELYREGPVWDRVQYHDGIKQAEMRVFWSRNGQISLYFWYLRGKVCENLFQDFGQGYVSFGASGPWVGGQH